jgi:hypothetical protein
MSAILETQPGGELVCIMPFSVIPNDARPGTNRRSFRIGERVRYVGYYQDKNLADNPAGWMVLFELDEPKGSRRFAATQTYFVTTESWEALKKYFAKGLMREPQRAVSHPIRKALK